MEAIRKDNALAAMFMKFVIAIGILFFLLTFAASYQNTKFFMGSDLKIVGLLVSAMVLIFAAAYVLANRLTQKQFVFVLLLIGIGLRLAWVLSIDTPPFSDFLDMRNAGVAAVNGDYSIAQNDYFSRWVYLLGFSMYEGLMDNLFGGSLLVLKLFNILFNVGTALAIYFAASKVFNEFCGRIASLLYAVYLPHILMCSVLTNQHLSTFLFALGCVLVVRGGFSAKSLWVWIGVLFALGNMIRPLGVFFLIGVVIYALIDKVLPVHKNQRLPILARIAGMVAVYFILMQLISYGFLWSGVTKSAFKSQEPYWKFMVGLNQQTLGGWSQEDTDYALQYKLGKERNEAELKLLKQRLQDKGQLMSLLAKKYKVMWGAEDASVMWSLWEQNKPDLAGLLTKTEKIMYLAMTAFALLSLLSLLVRNDHPNHHLFLLLLLGYAAIHIFIEIQTRYRFDILPSLFILQSFGVYFLYSLTSAQFNKRQPVTAGQ